MDRWINEKRATDQLTYWIFEAEQFKNKIQIYTIYKALICEI